ncbi:hypothetical protein BGW36DRAFT_296756 [Talaromyces proteolyticus]|uniref:Uncharacterized protein n=1 Tax=Talaromyces proteolyticus TaxID=1131652 RepID=A0AAD4KMY1_9EURO|nr:uncharacterized protein BGW36DRAFT_296756 [Talaromyces proteolyticus]KAH8696343.1 hypothetical protein BGW36DRAFT_296756 [Talaromyces proteolyticus]
MSSQRVIQDSEDESGDDCPDIATSIDPPQDSPDAHPNNSDPGRSARQDGAFSASIPESYLPQVDFDRYLRSESSIMAGEYEDERWASTANATRPGGRQLIFIDSTHREHLQDDSFVYRVNADYATLGTLPSTADTGRGPNGPLLEEGGNATDFEHPSKRRKISLTQDSLTKCSNGDPEPSTPYSCLASFDSNSPPQVTIPPSASLYIPQQDNTQTYQDHLPPRFETPPPTVPLSEDLFYNPNSVYQESVLANLKTSEIQNSFDQPPAFEVDTETVALKKKRGRPKKQALAVDADGQPEEASDDVFDQCDTAKKKKPGRSKKIDREASPDELIVIEMPTYQTNETEVLGPTSKFEKAAKKKIKRSKTASDLLSTTNKSKNDCDVWIDDTGTTWQGNSTFNPPNFIENDQSPAKKPEKPASEPKKRGRKRKSMAEGPPVVDTASPDVLQDISNTAHLPPKNEQRQNDTLAEGAAIKADNNASVELSKLENDAILSPTPLPETAVKKEATPRKNNDESNNSNREPAKHSSIPSTGKVSYRVGLSRRARIAPLLKVVRK